MGQKEPSNPSMRRKIFSKGTGSDTDSDDTGMMTFYV